MMLFSRPHLDILERNTHGDRGVLPVFMASFDSWLHQRMFGVDQDYHPSTHHRTGGKCTSSSDIFVVLDHVIAPLEQFLIV
jgi:hypothetical protein